MCDKHPPRRPLYMQIYVQDFGYLNGDRAGGRT